MVTDNNKGDSDKQAAERVENLILAIGTVTLDKADQILYARSEFENLTFTQKGLVDDDIYAILVSSELQLSRLLDMIPDGGGGDEGSDDGDNSPVEDGGDNSPDGDSGGQASGDEPSKPDGQKDGRNQDIPHTAVTAMTKVNAGATETGLKRSGLKYYEIDLKRLREELDKYVDEISMTVKVILAAAVTAAFLLGFTWRRRQYMKDRIKGRKL